MKKIKRIIPLLVMGIALTGCGKNVEKLEVGQTYTGNELAVKIVDSYVADYVVPEGLELDFDKYLAVDVEFENITEEIQHAQTLLKFELKDKTGRKDIVIDENDKKFAHEIAPGEKWSITLTFAVDNSDEYELYYSEGFKADSEDVSYWTIKDEGLEKRKVKPSLEHNKLGTKTKIERK